MPRPVTDIRNLGPAMERSFAKAGIQSADEIEELGADAAYARLIGAGTAPHFMAYLALVLGLQGRPFHDIAPEEKRALRARFDALRHGTKKGRSELEAALDLFGVRPAQPTSSRPEKK